MSGFVSSRILVALSLLGIALIAAGQWGQNGWMEDPHPPVKWRTFKAGQYSNIEKFRTTVMNSQADLQRYWQAHAVDDGPMPSGVDWNKEKLVAINLGTRSSGGYEVAVKSIERRKGDIVLTYIEKKPRPGQATLTVITSPWVIVRMDRISGPIEFEKKYDNNLGGIHVIDLGCGCTCKCCSAGKCGG